LREEGFEVVSVTDGSTALVRLADVDPDLVFADVSLPEQNGYEVCRFIKTHPRYRHTRVVLTAGALEPINEQEAAWAHADGSLRKPFEASLMVETARRLVAEAQRARRQVDFESEALQAAAFEAPAQPAELAPCLPAVEQAASEGIPTVSEAEPAPAEIPAIAAASAPAPAPVSETDAGAEASKEPVVEAESEPCWQENKTAVPVPDPQAVRAAVTLALESALPILIDEITTKVLLALEEDHTAT